MRITNESSFDQVAQFIVLETRRRGYTRSESVACLSDGIQESGLRPKIVSPNGKWKGIYQQDTSYPNRDNAEGQIFGFLDRLDAKRRSSGASPDIWKNIFWLQQAPGYATADLAFENGRQAYLTEIQRHTVQAGQLYDRFTSPGGDNVPDRPDFNEYSNWSENCSGRGGRKVDLWLLHTQEGDGNADSLARYIRTTEGMPPEKQVSYHYTGSEDYIDHGVTIVDVVDTDLESWSVGNANDRSINFCFAGSRASWTREQWLKQSRVIDVAAYIAVQDCKKYGISTNVVPPPYNTGTPGISDHNYVTQVIKWGSHTDVGPNFPWDVFAAAVKKYSGADSPTTPTTPTTPTKPTPVGPADDQLTLRWRCLGDQTLVEAVAQIRDQVLGTNDRSKQGAV